MRGFKVLAIDLDAQGNTSFTFRAERDGPAALGVLLGEITAEDAIQHTPYCDIIAGNKALAGADAFISQTGKEYRLREALASIAGRYDYIVIDTPPALGIATVNALTAADRVIIPAQADLYCLQGIADLGGTIDPIKRYCNPALEISGVLLTRYNSRSAFAREIAELAAELAGNIGSRVFDTTIREGIAVRKAQAAQTSIYAYSPRSHAAEDYMQFIDELLQKEGTSLA